MIDTTDIPRIFLYTKPADLRKGFAGLYALARTHLSDPIHGDLYLFLNRRRTLLKALRWDGTGLCILSKRLGQGRFDDLFRHAHTGQALILNPQQLKQLFAGHTAIVARHPMRGRLPTTGEHRPDPQETPRPPDRTRRPRGTPR